MIRTCHSLRAHKTTFPSTMSSVVVENRLPVEPVTSLATLPSLEEIPSEPTKSFAEGPDKVDVVEVPVAPFADASAVDPYVNTNVSIQAPPTTAPSRLQHMREAASYLSFFLAGYKLRNRPLRFWRY